MVKSIAVLATTLATFATFGEAITEGSWTTIEMKELSPDTDPLAPETGCGTDDRYAFGAYRGNTNKLVIQFEGGGLCWDKETCIDWMYTDKQRCIGSKIKEDIIIPRSGMQDKADDSNPLADWNHVWLPYCTCDFYWGKQKVDMNFGDDEPVYFNFNGYTNGMAVWQWVKTHYREEFGQDTDLPERLLVTGCSAGGYGASAHITHIAEDLKDTETELMLLPDSSPGVVWYLFRDFNSTDPNSENVIDTLFGEGIRENPIVKNWTEAEDVRMADLHLAHAKAYPELKISTFGFVEDHIIDQNEEQQLMSEKFANATDLCNVNSWVTFVLVDHCVISSSKFYTVSLPSGDLANRVIGEFAEGQCTIDDLPEDYVEVAEKECISANCPPQQTFPPATTSGSSARGSAVAVILSSMLMSSFALW